MTQTVSRETEVGRTSTPGSWVWTTLADIGTVASGGTPKTKDPDNFDGDIPWITPADLSGYTQKTISKGKRNISQKGLDSSSARLLPTGTVLFSSRAPVGYVVIADEPVSTNQGCKNLIPEEGIFNEYVYYYLKGNKGLAESYASGTTFLELSAKAFGRLPMPLPPLNEQRRIVEKIEELFTKLDAGVRSLEQVREQLKSYRRSVLKSAVEGELSREWRETHRDELEPASELLEQVLQKRQEKFAGKNYKEPAAPDTSEMPELPEEWHWVKTATLSELYSNAICAGPFGTIFKARDFRPSGIPIIFLRHVGEGEYLTQKPGFMDAEKWKELFQPYSVYGGELLVTKLGDPPGVCAIYPVGIGPAMVTPDVIKMSVDDKIANSRFLMHYYNSVVARRFAFGVAFGTTRLRMTLPIFREIPVPLPPFEEQRFIVAEVERRLSVVDKLEATVQENLKQAAGLRQSILKQAFSGELVLQDPDDEPASVLLERIQKEREERKASKKKQSRKPRPDADVREPSLFSQVEE